jgi:hypothetical protein
MKAQSILFSAAVAAIVSSAAATAQAAVTPVFQLVDPAGWSVGAPLSTSQDWAGAPSDPIDGTPNVLFNDAGAGLTPPALSPVSPGYVSGSGFMYSFSGPYSAVASLHAPTADIPTGAGTYVIVQTFGTLNPDFGTLLGITLTDPSATPLAAAQHLRSDTYNYLPHFASSFGDVEAQATIDEFWIPGFTGDFSARADMSIHASLQELRVDAILATPGAGGAAPFPLTSVPEPASCTLLSTATLGLIARRRRRTIA